MSEVRGRSGRLYRLSCSTERGTEFRQSSMTVWKAVTERELGRECIWRVRRWGTLSVGRVKREINCARQPPAETRFQCTVHSTRLERRDAVIGSKTASAQESCTNHLRTQTGPKCGRSGQRLEGVTRGRRLCRWWNGGRALGVIESTQEIWCSKKTYFP
ncbi:hypothetical protein SCLCIDRAFT_424398 [Scleroderma citrinum Foug A]|uniref:Uncharacterized protein n=1 Tax=Scleroderma citrinum Foug A TaxID=1036808 RepID=A0A0C3EC92_9AGAM|nr:hypothetical protein SCLCIDRAFT_424398 [Scleroderma citrinum Foug A]